MQDVVILLDSNEKAFQDPDMWFDDGNLILKAENTLFKIYGGLLAAQSSVFKDMLSFPPPEEGNPTLDGCTIVTVYDSPRDMKYFLKAVFDTSYFEPPPSHTELPIVEGVLRLSLKYDVQYLRRRALQHLLSTFPTSLKDWRRRDANRTIPPVENTPFAAFRIAREFDLPWLLPSILYCISSHPIEKTLDASIWEYNPITLSWPDKRMCILGRQHLLQFQNRNSVEFMKSSTLSVEGCNGETCITNRQRCADQLGSWEMAALLDYFEDNKNTYNSEFCSVCLSEFRDTCNSACQSLWDDLPAMFLLPDWTILKEMSIKALE